MISAKQWVFYKISWTTAKFGDESSISPNFNGIYLCLGVDWGRFYFFICFLI